MNNFQINGTVVADCEIKKIGDSNLITFSIANNDESKKKDDGTYENIASFFNVSYWNKSGKMASHILKGKNVTISGSLKQERWEKDGVKNSRVVLKAAEVIPHVYEKAGEKQFPYADPAPSDVNNTDVPF